MIQVTNNHGVTFNVRVLQRGMRYGLEDCIAYDETDRLFRAHDPQVEFYDATHAGTSFDGRGQFVSRYYLSNLAEGENHGVQLYGGERVWNITAQNRDDAVRYAREATEA